MIGILLLLSRAGAVPGAEVGAGVMRQGVSALASDVAFRSRGTAMAEWVVVSSEDAYSTEAILGYRSRFHLVYRLTARTYQAIGPGGAAHSAGWRAVLAVFVLFDVVSWLGLRRTSRFWFWPRLVIDALDVGFWARVPTPSGHYDAAVLIAAPLATESGMRIGPLAALLIPAGILAFVAPVRLASRRPVLPFTMAWLVMAAGAGAVGALYLRRQRIQILNESALRVAADNQRAFLGGQNAVAMGADSVVDQLQAVAPLLGAPRPGSAMHRLLDAWKLALRSRTEGHASYLGTVTTSWRRSHNLHPDLSSHVEINLPEGQGTTLLTAAQAAGLWAGLEHLPLRGVVDVAVVGDEHLQYRTPGQALELRIGHATLLLAADHTHRPSPPFDPAPICFIYAAVLAWHDIFPNSAHMPLPLVAAVSTAYLVCALWAHRVLLRRGQRARPTIVMVMVAIGAAYGLAGLLTMGLIRSPVDHGPFVVTAGTIIAPAIVAGFYWPTLATYRRIPLVAMAFVLVVAELTISRAHPGLWQIAVAEVWPMGAFLSCLGMGHALERSAASFDQALRAQANEDKHQRYVEGWNSVVDLVSQARDDAHTALNQRAADLPHRHRAELSRRLERIDSCLIQLRSEWPSSMTTKSPATDSPPA